MSCNNCGSTRIAEVSAKCGDMCVINYNNKEIIGDVPEDLGIGMGDYIKFSYCFNCGMMKSRNKFPISEVAIDNAMNWNEEDA